MAAILVFMALRIGKSVMLNFGEHLEPIFIFAGLAFLLLIGPLLRWYVAGMTKVDYKLPNYYFLELIPFVILFGASFFITQNWFESNDKEVIVVFASILIFIYLHFAFHIFMANRLLKSVLRNHPKKTQTKSQKAVTLWLRLLVIGFVLIWISYVLNIIDDSIPYIIGPIIYSIAIYFLSIKAFQLKVTDMDGTVFKKNDDIQLFEQISKLISEHKLYLKSNVSLSSISKAINRSTQKTSEVINQYAKQNFNDFINKYRIEEAKEILSDETKHTISAIAFDVGFNSLSSFNSAFKKFVGLTPSDYRNNNRD